MNPLKNFFYPKSICVAGAIVKEKSIGNEMLISIKSFGYAGKVFPVNPKVDEIFGYKCYHTIEEIEEPIDLGIIIVPKQYAESAVDAFLHKNVKAIILISAGFEEVGKEGEELQNKIVKKINDSGARLVGPNCMGLINTLEGIKLNATFVAEKPETGSTGFLSQSGALGAAVLNSLRESEIRFAHFISVGNKADVFENDILFFWNQDPSIKTLTFYLESFVDGKDFIKPFITGEIKKPVIVLKSGKTKSGMKAASSHTGALSGKDKVIDSLLKQFGIVRAENLDELFNTAKGFENFPLPKGNRIAVVTNAGGPAILCVDKLDNRDLVLADFTETTKTKLRGVVHPEGSINNPVDLLPGATPEIFKKVNEIVCADENVDAVISIFVEPIMVSSFDVVENINSITSNKPILQTVMPLPEFWEKYKNESSTKIPLFRNPEDPAVVLSNMLFYTNSQQRLRKNRNNYSLQLGRSVLNNSVSAKGFLTQEEIEEICRNYGIPLVKSKVLKSIGFNRIENDFYPLVIKGINKDVVHKSEINAVKLNIKNEEELAAASQKIINNFSVNGFTVEEFLIQQFIEAKHELIIGGFRDPSFGPVILFGSGGKYVEIFDDTTIKSCFLCDDDIEEMISSTKIGKILKGVRGEKPCDTNELKKIIGACARMMLENENIAEFDINPLIVDIHNKYYAVDVRIRC